LRLPIQPGAGKALSVGAFQSAGDGTRGVDSQAIFSVVAILGEDAAAISRNFALRWGSAGTWDVLFVTNGISGLTIGRRCVRRRLDD